MRTLSLKTTLIVAVTFSLSLSCKKKEEETSLNYQIPQVTDPVGMVRGASVGASSTSLKLNDFNSWGTCVAAGNCNNTTAQQMFNMGSNFVTLGSAADMYTCFAQSLVNGKDLATDGSATVLTDSGFKVRMTATVSGDSLATYTIQVCEAGATANAQYTAGTMAADGTTSIVLKLDGTRWVSSATNFKTSINLTGNYSGGIWNSKQLTMEDVETTGPSYSKSVITQGSDHLIIQGAGTGGWQLYGKFTMQGSTASDYSFDAGSAITPGPVLSSWDGNGNTGGSTFATDVQSGQMISAPTSFSGGMSSSENWDCQTGSDKSIAFESVSDATSMGMISCMQQ